MISLGKPSLRGTFGAWKWARVGQGSALILAVISLGCGRDATDSTVPPPSPVVVDTGQASDSTAPGEIELPPGEIPASSDAEPATSGGIEMPENAVLPGDTSAAPSPTIQFGTWDEIESEARSSGRITVVDLWSLACEPCLKEFPGLVRLHQSLGSKVQCIAVDLDFDGRKSRPPEYYQAEVTEFLRSVDANGFPTYISSTPSDEVFAAANLVSIPAVLIFDAEGQIVKVFVDAGESAGFTYEKDIAPLVAKLAG